MAALFLAFILGSVLMFWNVHALIEFQRRSPKLKEVFSLNVTDPDRRAFVFIFVAFSCFLIFGTGSFFASGRNFWGELKSNIDDFILVFLFLLVLFNYLVRMVARNYVDESLGDSQKHVWDVWKMSARKCTNQKIATVLRCSNIALAFIVFVFFAVKLGI